MSEDNELTPYELESLRSAGYGRPDWMLQLLVKITNESQLRMGMTFFIGGSIISGDMVGGREYFDRFGPVLKGESPGTEVETSSSFDELKDAYYPISENTEEEADGGEKDDVPGPTYVHMLNVKVFAGGMTPFQGAIWRGRLSQVDAWILGRADQS